MDSQKESGRSEKKAPGSRVWHMFTPGVLGSLWDRQIRPWDKRCAEAVQGIGEFCRFAVQRQCRSQAVTKEAVSKAAFRRIWEDIPCSWFLLSPWPSVLSSETNPGQGLCCGTLCRSHAHTAVFLSSHRTAGAAPLLAWNRMLQSPNQFQPAQYQGLGPMGYPQRPEDRMDRGRQVGTQGPAGCAVFSFQERLPSPVAVEKGARHGKALPSWS